MATLIQLRRDTAANWSSNNPILSSGEIGIATDLQQFKIGNSASSWNQLEYVNAIPSKYLSLIAASANFLTKTDAGIIYAPLGSASFVGTPTAPTATAGTNTQQIATTAFVRTEVTNLIDSAPGTLDTLNELAAALGDDPNYAVSTASYIATKLDINNASATYLSISNAALTYVPISASSNIVDNYIPISSSYAYLTRDDASSLYIPITASGPYLTELEASALYVPISASANVVENYIPISSSYAYLTRSDAENTYIPISSSAEYLTESEAQGIYVPISSSANIVENYIPVSASFAYLTRSDAESTYIPITASAEYLTESEAQGIYVPISSSANIVENYIPTSSSYAYLTRTDAESTYIPITSSAAYLTENEAESIYVPITASAGIVENYIPVSSSYAYLTRVDAESKYIPISSSAEYLTETEAAGSYVPISSSANIVENYIPVSSSYAYLTRSDAETIYIPIASSAAYLTETEAAGLYIPISASFGTFDADKLDGRDSSYFINTSSESQEKLGDVTFHGTVSIEDLIITGSALTISTTNLALTDSLIQLAHQQYSTDSVDIGIIGSYGDGTTSSVAHYHASFTRDASQNKWKLLSNGPAPVNNVIDYSDPSVEYAVLQVGAVEVSSSAKVNNLNADLLDDQNGSYYLDWTNATNKPDPIIGVNLIGNTTGAASATLTDIANGQISITTNTTFASTASSINWAGVTGRPTTLSGYGITDAITVSASQAYLTRSDAGIVYAPLASASLTGTPIATTAAPGTNTQQIATTAYVQNALSSVSVSNSTIQSAVVSPTTAGSTGVRRITISTSGPSGGSDGDIWFKYV